ncbi:MAG: T9SS type A sorting domain-containing protein [Bacteroidia bacterium]
MKNAIQKIKSISIFSKLFLLMLILMLSQKSYSQTWSDVGGGMCDWVNASVVYNGELIVGGRFTCANGVPANYIAKWNGTSWSALGTGVNGWVDALTVYKGNLIVGGSFSQAGSTAVMNLAKWNGTSWSDVNGDMGGQVQALTVYNNDLIVGGYFTDADGFTANYIVGYNNIVGWFDLGGGMSSQVMALNVYGTDLIAAGFFTTAGGTAAPHIAKWNGTSWSSLGSGIAWITYSLGTYQGDLIAGGLFSQAGGVTANSIAKWDGTSWAPLGSGMGATSVGYNYVFALAEYNGSLFAGGMYESAGGVLANSIAKWDGTSWIDLNGGVWYGGSNVYAVNALTVYNNDLYASGIFTSAGAESVAHIAKWNEPPLAINEVNPASAIQLSQNSPNPFNQSTSISYSVYVAGNIKVVVNDITGREIKMLVNETKQAGDYAYELNGNDLSQGIYFLKLISGNTNQTIKLIKTE